MRSRTLIFGVIGAFILMQVVPYGRRHINPPVVQEPQWDSAATRAMVKGACFDCHSNETTWPRYSWVAPSSWLVQNDVDGGRRHLNFSEWNREQRHAKDASEEVRSGDMPPVYYGWMHEPARLTAEERQQLAASFEKMFGPPPPKPAR